MRRSESLDLSKGNENEKEKEKKEEKDVPMRQRTSSPSSSQGGTMNRKHPAKMCFALFHIILLLSTLFCSDLFQSNQIYSTLPYSDLIYKYYATPSAHDILISLFLTSSHIN